jgi:hypothetical protein
VYLVTAAIRPARFLRKLSTRRSRAKTHTRMQSIISRTLHTSEDHHKPTYRY